MFSVVSWFSSSISLIGLGGFSPDSHFFLTISRLTESTFEERGNCNNMTLRAENSQSRSHVTIIIQNFILVSLISITMPHPIGFWHHGSVSSYVFDHLYLTSHCLCSRKIFPAIGTICVLFTY